MFSFNLHIGSKPNRMVLGIYTLAIDVDGGRFMQHSTIKNFNAVDQLKEWSHNASSQLSEWTHKMAVMLMCTTNQHQQRRKRSPLSGLRMRCNKNTFLSLISTSGTQGSNKLNVRYFSFCSTFDSFINGYVEWRHYLREPAYLVLHITHTRVMYFRIMLVHRDNI